eukprot:gene23581-9109_t
MQIVVEPSGAAGLAAVLSPQFSTSPALAGCSKIGVILCGGNVDLGAKGIPPHPKVTEKTLVGAKVSVRVPKDLFAVAAHSGNTQLVQRSKQQQQQNAIAKLSAADILLQKATQRRITVRTTPIKEQGAKRKFKTSHHFDPEEIGVFPPRAPELHAIDDFVDVEGERLPDNTHPYGWVPPVEQEPGATALRPRTGQIQTHSSTTLPLEFFDSPEMELTPPEQRLEEGKAADPNGRGPVGFSRFYNTDGEFSWSPCTVLEYCRERDMYLIEWHATQRTKWVKRLNLFFQNESRIGFRFRLRQARRRKEEVEREARYHEYVSHHPFRNHDVLEELFKDKIIARLGNDANVRMPTVAKAYMEEVHENFKFSVNSAIVDFQFNDPAANAHLSAANVQPVKVSEPVPPQGTVNLRMDPPGKELYSQPEVGLVESAEIGVEDFSTVLLDAHSISFQASTPLLDAMQQYYHELDVQNIRLADTELSTLPLPARLADFVRVIAIVERLLPVPSAAGAATGSEALSVDPIQAEDSAEVTEAMPSLTRGHQMVTADGRLTEAQRTQVLRYVKMLSLTMADQVRRAGGGWGLGWGGAMPSLTRGHQMVTADGRLTVAQRVQLRSAILESC